MEFNISFNLMLGMMLEEHWTEDWQLTTLHGTSQCCNVFYYKLLNF